MSAARLVAAHRQCAQRVAVIALPARDEDAALGLTDLDEVLPRHLEGGFDRLRAAADEVDVFQPGRGGARQLVGERLRRLRGEEAGVRVGQAIDLRMHGRRHRRMAVAQARHGGAAAGIEILLARRIREVNALAGDRDRRRDPEVAVQDVGHGLTVASTRSSAS